MFGGDGSLTQVLSYVKEHGGGTIALSSQSSAATAIVGQDASVAGIGGFSGRESDVSVSWLAQEVRSGKIRWVLGEQGGAQAGGPRLAGDARSGARAAMKAVAKACPSVKLPSSTGTAASGQSGTLYDCSGRSQALLSAGG
jgi:hypothetical protein